MKKKRPRKAKVVRIKLPADAFKDAFEQVEEDALIRARQADRVDVVFLDEEARKLAALPLPKSQFRRLLDRLGF